MRTKPIPIVKEVPIPITIEPLADLDQALLIIHSCLDSCGNQGCDTHNLIHFMLEENEFFRARLRDKKQARMVLQQLLVLLSCRADDDPNQAVYCFGRLYLRKHYLSKKGLKNITMQVGLRAESIFEYLKAHDHAYFYDFFKHFYEKEAVFKRSEGSKQAPEAIFWPPLRWLLANGFIREIADKHYQITAERIQPLSEEAIKQKRGRKSKKSILPPPPQTPFDQVLHYIRSFGLVGVAYKTIVQAHPGIQTKEMRTILGNMSRHGHITKDPKTAHWIATEYLTGPLKKKIVEAIEEKAKTDEVLRAEVLQYITDAGRPVSPDELKNHFADFNVGQGSGKISRLSRALGVLSKASKIRRLDDKSWVAVLPPKPSNQDPIPESVPANQSSVLVNPPEALPATEKTEKPVTVAELGPFEPDLEAILAFLEKQPRIRVIRDAKLAKVQSQDGFQMEAKVSTVILFSKKKPKDKKD